MGLVVALWERRLLAIRATYKYVYKIWPHWPFQSKKDQKIWSRLDQAIQVANQNYPHHCLIWRPKVIMALLGDMACPVRAHTGTQQCKVAGEEEMFTIRQPLFQQQSYKLSTLYRLLTGENGHLRWRRKWKETGCSQLQTITHWCGSAH